MASKPERREQRAVRGLRLHALAHLVPAMLPGEFAAFLTDIAAHGIEQPLEITPDGEILDGRHRFHAAQELGWQTVPVHVVEPAEPVAYMLRSALQRRQLSASQRAALALDLDQFQTESLVATLPPGRRSRDLAAQIAGVCPRTVQDARTVQTHDPALFARIRCGEIHAHKARLELQRRQRYQTIQPSPPLPAGLYELMLADPPWQLGNPDSDYAPEQYYPTLPLEEIAALQVPAAEDALLYLWAVNSHLPDALRVMAAWGFDYRGCEVWVKPWIGMGVWTRNRHELLLIGRKGAASPAPRRLLLDSVIEAPRGRHSQKPETVYQRLEHLYPSLARLELFARGNTRPGWTAWGNQANQETA
ncbi:MAG TPA: MT-A70 family methyltransferase [Gaiellaceae bacterium]|nr:MT-A70 family methyltransferase [Gaiellaceae bacterium]